MPLLGTPAPAKRKKSSRVIIKALKDVEGTDLNLGKKISIPRDVMLEELSLLNNKGSKMFKQRKLRVEKFIYESNPDIFNSDSMDNFQRYLPYSGVHGHGGVGISGGMASGGIHGSSQSGKHSKAPVPYPKPQHLTSASGGGQSGTDGHGTGSVGGSGGIEGSATQLGGVDGGKGSDETGKKYVSIIKTYISPWERAMGNDPELKATMDLHMAAPAGGFKLHLYKSFNRSAEPYGGFEKAAKLMTFQLPEFDPTPPEPETVIVSNQDISTRPNFNRTPLGWTPMSTETLVNLGVDLEFNAETDDL